MNGLTLWQYEVRRAGRYLLAASPLLAVLMLVTGLGLPGAGFAGNWLTQAALPLVAGVAAATITTGEHAVELHLTLPTPLRTTLCRRLALLGASSVSGAVLLAAGLLPGGQTVSRFALVCSFGALLVAAGAWSAAVLRSVAGASTVVLSVWFADLFVLDRIFAGPAAQVPARLVFAALFTVLAARLVAEGRGLAEGSSE